MGLLIDQPTYVPDVRALNEPFDGDSLVLEGYASTEDVDRESDVMLSSAFAGSLARYLTTNPVVLYAHKRTMPPIGKVLAAELRPAGLWVRALLPRPPKGSGMHELIWDLARQGMMKAFSVGGHFTRQAGRIVAADLQELSLAPIGVNPHAYATSARIETVHGKSLGDLEVAAGGIDAYVERLDQLRLREFGRRADLIGLKFDVAAISRTAAGL